MSLRVRPQTAAVSGAVLSHPDFFNRLSKILFLTAVPVVAWIFCNFTSHTIVLKAVAFDCLIVWSLAARWLGLNGFRRAEVNPSLPKVERIRVIMVFVAALTVIRLVIYGMSLSDRDPGWVELLSDSVCSLLLVLLASPLVVSLWKRNQRAAVTGIAVWFLALVLTTILARNPILSVFSLRDSLGYLAAGLLALDLASNPRDQRRLVLLLVAVMLSLSIYGLFQSLNLDFFPWKDYAEESGGEQRISGPMGNPDFFGGYLAGMLPLCLALILGERRLGIRILSFAAMGLGLWSLYQTRTLGAWLGFSCGLIFMIYAFYARAGWSPDSQGRVSLLPDQHRKFKWWVIAPIATTILLILLAIPAGLKLKSKLENVDARSISTQSRYWMWVGAANMWKAHPWFGVGPGNFAAYFPEFRPVELSKYQPPDRRRVDHAHSEYLELAAEMGYTGTLAFFFLLAVLFTLGFRQLFHCMSPARRWMLLGALGSLISLLAHNAITVNLRWTSSLFLLWMLLGLIGAHPEKTVGKSAERIPLVVIWRIRYPILVAVFLTVCAVTFYRGGLLLSDIYAANGKAILLQGMPSEAVIRFRRALRLDPRRIETRYYLASAYYDNRMYEESLNEYNNVIRNGRYFVNVIFNKATVLGRMGRFDEAIQLYQQAVEADPNYARLHDYMGRMYFQKGIKEESEEKKMQAREMALAECSQAAVLYENTIKESSWDAVLHKDYGICLLLCGEFTRAQAALREAGRLDPRLPGVQNFLKYAIRAAELEKEQGREKVMEILMGSVAGE